MPPEFETEIIRKKEQIRGSLFRANSLAVFLVGVLVLLGIGAVVQAFRAEQAEGEATEKLWESYLTQARALRYSGQPGRKEKILNAVKTAAKIRPSAELRDEAIAALAMKDLIISNDLRPVKAVGFDIAFEEQFKKYLLTHPSGSFVVRDWASHSNIYQGVITNGIESHYISPQGNYIVLGAWNGEARVVDLRDRAEIISLKSATRSFANISPDERILAAITKTNEVTFFDLDEATEMDRFTLPVLMSVPKFAPDGRTIAIGDRRIVNIFRYVDNRLKLVRRLETPREFTSLSWSADGRHLAVGCMDWNIYVWDIKSGAAVTLKGHTREVVSVSFSPVDLILMTYAWDGTTRFWNALTGDLLFVTHEGWGRGWSADGKTIGFFKYNAGFGRWGFEYSDCLSTMAVPIGTAADVRVLDFSRDGKYFLTGNASRMIIRRSEGTEVAAEVPEREFKAASFLPDGRTLLTSGVDRVRRWEMQEEAGGQLGLMLREETRPPVRERPERAVISKQGGWTAVDCMENLMAIFEGTDFSNQKGSVRHIGGGSMDFSPDEKTLAIGSWYGEGVAVYEIPSGKRVRKLDERDAEVRFSQDGKWLVAGATDAYRVFDGKSYSNVWTLTRNSAAQTSPMAAWSPVADRVAVTLTGLSQEIVDVNLRKVVARLIPPFEKVVSNMRFSPDGKKLAVTTYERTIYLWDLERLENGLKEIGLNLFEPIPQYVPPAKPRLLVYTILFVVAMLGALLLAGIALKKHRGLLLEYNEAEMAMLRRNRELEVARAELAHSQKMRALGTLAAGIAHDFNNLLSIIRMANQLTTREAGNNADIKENSQVIEEAVRQGKDVVKSMLGYSRANDSSAQEVAVPELVEDLVPLLSKQFLSGITLKLELDYTVPKVRTVPQRLEQILLNLIVNASEALQGHGRLTISTKLVEELPGEVLLRPSLSAEYVRVTVQDNGPGVSPEIVDRIFEPFFTTKNSGSTRGTGLGLSIVHTIAEEEGYGIELENNPGFGAVFHIYIPRVPVGGRQSAHKEVVSSG